MYVLGRIRGSIRNSKHPFVACVTSIRSMCSCFFVFHAAVLLLLLIKCVVTGQAPVTLELRNAPGNKQKQTKGGARIYHS